MRLTLLRRIDVLARQLSPMALTLGLMLVGVVPLRLPMFEPAAPSLTLIAVFYWTLYRPDLMPAATSFGLGLLQDVFTGIPLGVSAAVLVLVHAIVFTQRQFFLGKPFHVVWTGFSVIACLAFGVAGLLVSAFHGVFIDPAVLAVRILITAGCFPAVTWMLMRCHLVLLRTA